METMKTEVNYFGIHDHAGYTGYSVHIEAEGNKYWLQYKWRGGNCYNLAQITKNDVRLKSSELVHLYLVRIVALAEFNIQHFSDTSLDFTHNLEREYRVVITANKQFITKLNSPEIKDDDIFWDVIRDAENAFMENGCLNFKVFDTETNEEVILEQL